MASHDDDNSCNSTASSQRRWLVATTHARHNDDGSYNSTVSSPRRWLVLLAVNVWDKRCVSHPQAPWVVVNTSFPENGTVREQHFGIVSEAICHEIGVNKNCSETDTRTHSQNQFMRLPSELQMCKSPPSSLGGGEHVIMT